MSGPAGLCRIELKYDSSDWLLFQLGRESQMSRPAGFCRIEIERDSLPRRVPGRGRESQMRVEVLSFRGILEPRAGLEAATRGLRIRQVAF
jgi:hypothetical protein